MAGSVKALVILLFALLQLAQGCIHHKLDHKVVDSQQHYGDIHPFDVANRKRRLDGEDVTNFQTYESAVADDAYQPIRITPYYDEATLSLITEDERTVLYQVVGDAIERFQNALKVVPVQGKLAAQHTCSSYYPSTPRVCSGFVKNEKCLEMVIPAEHFGATLKCSTCPSEDGCKGGDCEYSDANGVENTDFLLYVRSADTVNCGSRTLAYASSCQKDQYDRPTFGMVNFCPTQISTLAEDYESQVSTAMHEMTHALGFSAQFFPLMRYPDGTPRTPRDEKGNPPTYRSGTCPDGSEISYYVEPSADTVQYSTERGHSVAKMVTPNVAAFVQSHFGCESLSGAEIEQQDGTGCLGSHWEERIFEPEYMTPVDSFRNVFSALTLAFFEDSGWYRANVSAAERMHFGESRGCAFATEKCINPETGVSIASDHFCTSNSAESCSVDATSRSVCSLLDGESIPNDYQYFPGDPTKGGDSYPDYCPINVGYTYGDCSNANNLQLAGQAEVNILGESYGSSSRCTASTLRSEDSTNWVVNAYRQTGCYAMRCYASTASNDSSQSTIELTIPRSKTNDAVRVNCTTKGEQLSVPGFSGLLTCPDPNVICDSAASYSFVHDSGTGGTGSGTVNLRSPNAATTQHSTASWVAHLVGLFVAVYAAAP
ncbi:Leishmanolysin metalloprotease M8, Zn-binding site [Phytophthora sojae]|uniref:Leishmanolysin metalloprotease M8, Zn-binding site n=1 Tax=Phytophthora sojae (strain P6497) TaxID=1094619 RepID=G5ACF4_PHYSP|nr:Leishmanolysin metalloprotease M8, Zn-binding site [Phytophthora sojae]EGZ07028.1 Leishmanolysin metalloprotease M8, Zn-binding site [Phytophthora sojae]|eukprot:XP_009537792.1 Leishmanolysin metalloprotease M8, Zn-binding site [Phytophthora sojae]